MGDIEVPQPGASEIVGRLLSEALREHPDVQWLGLMSEDGFAIASEGAEGVDDDAVAAGAVRMMVQVRTMAKALGQSGTSQLFLEGSDSGICVIDKDPWVLVMVGAPGVPIGLLRYEAREIAEAFPMGNRAELPAAHAETEEPQTEQAEGSSGADADPLADASAWWTGGVGSAEPEIRWADEPTSDDPAGVGQQEAATDLNWGTTPVVDIADEAPSAEASGSPVFEVTDDLADLQAGTPPEAFDLTPEEPAAAVFDLAPAAQPEPVAVFDLAPPEEHEQAGVFDLSPQSDPAAVPAGFALDDEPVAVDAFDLADLAAPTGPAIDLPPPVGPAFELPPPE